MLETTLRIIIAFINPIVGYHIIRNFGGKDKSVSLSFKVFLIFVLAVSNLLIYNVSYNSLITLINFLLTIIVYKALFKTSLFESIILSTVLFIILTLADVVVSLILVSFVTAEEVRKNVYYMLIGNVSVGLLSYALSYAPFINNNVKKFVEKSEDNHKVKIVVFFLLTILLASILLYAISINYKLINEYILIVVIMCILIVLFLIYIMENNNRMQFEAKYLSLFDYFKTFEDMIDSDREFMHEYKNQLAAIREMNNISSVRKYINSILGYVDNSKVDYISDLKFIPKCGVKGIIYYKLMIAKNKNISVTINVNKNIKELEFIDSETQKNLIKVLGICLDNAIEASEVSEKKNISLEIYKMSNEIRIVICNTYNSDLVDLNKIENKGYSTKGKGRGNGLYYLSKVISSQKTISTEWVIMNDYFVRKIFIKI